LFSEGSNDLWRVGLGESNRQVLLGHAEEIVVKRNDAFQAADAGKMILIRESVCLHEGLSGFKRRPEEDTTASSALR
jgi:hypothetical protein